MRDWFPELAQREIQRQAEFACVEVFDELSSTSDYALANMAAYDDRMPALFVARQQTKGRGRGTRSWFAGDGALTFSALLAKADTPIPPQDWPRSSLMAGVAMCQTLEQYVDAEMLKVKWPNDVYLAGRKVCGILVEKRELAEPVMCLGVGVNVNNSLEHAPHDVQQKAIALTDVTHQEHFLPEILLEFLIRYRALSRDCASSLEPLLPFWREHCLLTGRQIETVQGGQQVAGECHGIDASGALLVQTSAGQRQIVSGEIVRW
ncbi:biotin--[acetyl-CoA-carboxylase] ligase [Blastopirellula marina]|uniref:biotin--[biotin carboxyl-carrier protein] ligase n=1 Tax=Blastopirellula marina TaxID=124 RepID=A0A2S8G0N1_9BACT|nr:biotin--[acetyl-CoA-carboxylase] ligase [Blastopirellula marina]PQO37997.1 biotin--[acetyl-CoA-carboxylase] ligase [Blastopirellula marina]PTL44653.1 biotin--[acetyl-CoA-carboxylase] ligase [Blastopirellula marina]